MILTEEEAKTKWCPDTRILMQSSLFDGALPYVVSNRYNASDFNCMASGCAQWVWSRFDEKKVTVAGYRGGFYEERRGI